MNKFHPILFSTQMVLAILADRKTMTRRIIKPQPHEKAKEVIRTGQWHKTPWVAHFPLRNRHNMSIYEVTNIYKCPYGEVGDVLWVRETFFHSMNMGYIYEADGRDSKGTTGVKLQYSPEFIKWRPSLFMPKEACRLFLKITSIRVERIQDISEEDAKAEGAPPLMADGDCESFFEHPNGSYIGGFYKLWEKINSAESWNSNPWVWVIEFTKIEKPSDFIK